MGQRKEIQRGQKLQTLDDLLFIYIDTVAKLKPKVAILENVEGLTLGNAWKYVQEIYTKFNAIGYKVKHWLLKGEQMGVLQTRHRVFFVATRLDFDLNKISMAFNYAPIMYKEFKTSYEKMAHGKMSDAIKQRLNWEKVEDTMKRLYGVKSGLTHRIAFEDKVFPTQIAGHDDIWTVSGNHPSKEDVIHAATFPEDYDCGKEKAEYICGMSVPPIMIKRLMTRLIESGLFDYKLKQ